MIFLKRHLELYILKENYIKIIFKFDIGNLIFDIVINLSQDIFLQECWHDSHNFVFSNTDRDYTAWSWF